ncbi:uncharacterized protein [Arachis hypogaea]|uniref:uncharacterized protein n=1 Tax=Arachis hypogaea TaxID=3818 RepID=UPI000DEC394D|nr:uncharacterized protein LOC112697770 [Arachis hypogaea]
MALVGCGKRKGKDLEEKNGVIVKKRGNDVDHSIVGDSEEILRKEICQKVATFLVMSGIPLKAVKSVEFQKMWESVARCGPGYIAPSIEDLRGKLLKYQVERIKEAIEDHKIKWKRTGCSILIDSWNNGYGMTIFNFFVNSPKGTVFLKSVNATNVCNNVGGIFEMIDGVVNEVGIENVVQVVTKNEDSFKAAGKLLMEKRSTIFWMPCAVHCIELMFEEFEKRVKVHRETIANGRRITTYIYSRASVIDLLHYFTKGKDLIRPAATRGATSYLTLDCLNRNKDALEKMFTSKSWKSIAFSRSRSGKQVENIVMDSKFWKNIEICLKGANPLIKVLRLVNSDEKPAMGFVYKEMMQVKEKIQSAFNSVKQRYMPLWNIIDEKWDKEVHRPLEATAYYLNPQFHYSPDFKDDFDVKYGLYSSLCRTVAIKADACTVDRHLEEFKNARNAFGSELAKSAIKTKKPAEWWDSYGSEFPELQNFAIRILSLTCSAYGCTTNWDTFDKVHSKKRSRRRQKTWNDVLFAMSNLKVTDEKKKSKAFAYSMEDIASDDEWYVENIESSTNNEEPELYDAELIIPAEDDTPKDQYGYIDDLRIPDIDSDFNDDDDDVANDDYGDDDGMESDGDDMEDDDYDD